MPTVKPMRYAHSEGYTDVCYDDSGRYILTCGTDGDVRIWDGIDDDDALSHRCGDAAYSVAYKNKRYFAGTDYNTIQACTFPDGNPDGILTRFTAPVNSIVLNNDGTTLVAGSSDFSVKVVNVSNCSHKTCFGHEAPVLSVSLDPKEEFLASSSCDGTVRIWNMSDYKQAHSFSLLPKCSDTSLSKTVCRMAWDKDGKVLFVPVEKEIHIYERGTWTKKGSITESTITAHVSVLALSPDGNYLLAGCSDGWICVFDVKSRKCVDKHRNERGYSITSLAWNPKNNMEIVFCDNQGQLGLMTDISISPTTRESSKVDDSIPEGVFDDDDDLLIQATNDADSDVEDSTQSAKAKPIFSDDDDDTDSVMNVKKGDDDNDDASSTVSDRVEIPRPVVVEGFKPTPLQRAFQSGSTPQHLSSRYMVWNAVGIVKQYNTEEENSIDIEFHDTSVHHAMHVTNNFSYTMADLSTEAVVLASEYDSDSPSKLTCMHFASWDNSKEWSTTMSDDEEIECVTLGEGWVAVATDTRNLRLFSITGIQKEMFTLPGPVVCMAGHTNQLVVVYHRGMGIPGEQCLGVSVMNVRDWKNEVKEEPLPLSPITVLSWIGFSAEGTPFYMDSNGILRMLNRQAARTWVQVANTRQNLKGKSDHNWIVGIHENPQQIRCVPCKGSRYPPTLPRPAVTVIPFQIPLCESSTEKTQYEELLWRTQVMAGHFDAWNKQGYEVDETLKAEAKKPMQEALMKLFALSARSEREYRALEVCDMMTDQHTLQLAIKYSSRMRYMNLAEKISELAVRKAEEEAAKAYAQSYEEEEEEPSHGHTSYARQVSNQEGTVDTADETQEVDMEEEDDGRSAGPMLAVKAKETSLTEKPASMLKARSNPFKVSSGTPHPNTGLSKGTQVFDSLSKKKDKPVLALDTKSSSQKSVLKVSQPKLFMKKKTSTEKRPKTPTVETTNQKNPSPFDLWMEDNQEKLRAENPDVDEEEFSKVSAEKFRALPKEERQEWMKKSKDLKENKSKENSDCDNSGDKKRKREDNDSDEINKKLRENTQDEIKKAPLSSNTNSKLAGFAFKKDES